MKVSVKQWWVQLSAKQRQLLVVLGVIGLVLIVVALMQSDPDKKNVYSRRDDQDIQLLSGNAGRNVTIDQMSARLKNLQSSYDKLSNELAVLQDTSGRGSDATVRTLQKQISDLKSQLAQMSAQNRTAAAQAVEREKRLREEIQGLKGEGDADSSGAEDGSTTTASGTSASPRTAPRGIYRDSQGRVVTGNPFAHVDRSRPAVPAAAPTPGTRPPVTEPGSARPAAVQTPSRPTAVVFAYDSVQTREQAAAKEVAKAKKNAKTPDPYIPAGAILTGTILTGGDFPTGKGAMNEPVPLLVRLQKEAILPNRYTSDLRECFFLMGGHGNLSSERAALRGETLSCIKTDGSVIETKLNAVAIGEDGKEGVKGRLVSKQGQLIARSLLAGFASGASEAFDYSPVSVLNTGTYGSGSAPYISNYSSEALRGGFAKGASQALDRIADFYMNLADQIFPVVEINAGRQIDIVVTAGASLPVTAKNDTSGEVLTP